MKLLVDEMSNFSEDCPLNKIEWDNDMWVEYCSLNKRECNLHEREGECYGLKKWQEGASDEAQNRDST